MKLTKEAILTQLNLISSSTKFSESYKLQRFLKYVVTEFIEGRGNNLKQYNIAISAFDRNKDFDPNTDPIVRIQAGRLRTSLYAYYNNQGKTDPVLIEIRKGSYKPTITKNEVRVPGINSTPYQNDVIAVEKFKNLSEDKSRQYIADGFKEELLLELARYDHLTIIRLSNEINSNAGQRFARFVLRGSLRFAGLRIKLVVHVEDLKKHDFVWSQKFDLPVDPRELISSQEEIARSVANKVGDVIGGVVFNRLVKESRNRTVNDMISYDALLKFYHYQKAPLLNRFNVALGVNQKALKSDPENGICWAILATLTIDSVALGLSPSKEKTLEKALEYALKAIEFEPNMQPTRTFLSYAYLMTNQFDKAIMQAEIALNLNPNAAYYVGSLGWVMALAGNWKKGLNLIEEGIYLNQGYPMWYHQAPCLYYLGTNDFERALIEANKFNIPELFWDPMLKAVCYAYVGKQKDAFKQANSLIKMVPGFLEDGEALIKMYVKEKMHVTKIIEGLEKAGVRLLNKVYVK